MTVELGIKQEWRAVAPSGRVVAVFQTRKLFLAWRETHPSHNVKLVLVTTIEQDDPWQ